MVYESFEVKHALAKINGSNVIPIRTPSAAVGDAKRTGLRPAPTAACSRGAKGHSDTDKLVGASVIAISASASAVPG